MSGVLPPHTIRVRTPAKVVWLGEHFVHETGGIASAVSLYFALEATACDACEDLEFVPGEDESSSLHEALRSMVAAVRAHAGEGVVSSRLPYRVRVVQDEVPRRVGLGSSSCQLVSVVALLRALSGRALDRWAIFQCARAVERAWSGASGMDVAACVFGGTHFVKGESMEVRPIAHFPTECYVTLSGEEHAASCVEAGMHEAAFLEMSSLLARALHDDAAATFSQRRLPPLLDEAHALLKRCGLSSDAVDNVVATLAPGAKVTGRGRGGAVLSVGSSSSASRLLRVSPRGVCVEDGLFTERVPASLVLQRRVLLAEGSVGEATAHPNIALVKYWGKRAHQMPDNASISLTLPHFATHTRVSVRRCAGGVVPDARVGRFLREGMLRGVELPPGCHVVVETSNTFPTACGVASSASGFAALAMAVARMLGEEKGKTTTRDWVCQWARLGSGSAIRSVDSRDGESVLVSWSGSTATVHEDVHPSLRDLEHCLVVFDPMPKRVSSSDGHARAPDCPFHPMRVAAADGHVADVVRAFAQGDFAQLRAVTEAEALTMHLVMLGSGVRYMNAASVDFVARFVAFRDERQLEAMYTVDAGSNVHLLWKPSARHSVLGFVRAVDHHKHMFVLHRGLATHHRYSAVLLSGKRFSGKTTLAHAMVRASTRHVRMVHLSTLLKARYWDTVREMVDKDDVESREVKEAHRARMIAFGEEMRAQDPYYWCRTLWEELDDPHQSLRSSSHPCLLVTDARRPADVAFFRAACRPCVHVRLTCSDEERTRRGWTYDPAVDAGPSECGLDDEQTADVVVESGATTAEEVWRLVEQKAWNGHS